MFRSTNEFSFPTVFHAHQSEQEERQQATRTIQQTDSITYEAAAGTGSLGFDTIFTCRPFPPCSGSDEQMPSNFRSLTNTSQEENMVQGPNLDTFVVCRARDDVGLVQIGEVRMNGSRLCHSWEHSVLFLFLTPREKNCSLHYFVKRKCPIDD